MRITYFNARLREGGDHALILLISERVKFQSPPPRRRRLQQKVNYLPCFFQSTPPRRRRRCSANLFSCCFPFSIHASAKEATKIRSIPCRSRKNFSIHASAKEATLVINLAGGKKNVFNPRLREGGDYKALQAF